MARTLKPTPAQLDVLRKMRDDACVLQGDGCPTLTDLSGFWNRVREETVTALVWKGLVTTRGGLDPTYKLTPSGLAALEAAEKETDNA